MGYEVKMEEFSNIYHTGLYTELDTTGHEAALELANFGNVVISMEENTLVCYLPNKTGSFFFNSFLFSFTFSSSSLLRKGG